MDTSILRSLGLTENEVKIYIYLLKAGLKTPYDISKDTGVYRAHVYDKLEQLQDKGLVTHINKEGKKHFQAKEPEKILQYLDEKRKDFDIQEENIRELLPELEKLREIPKEETFVEVFKGKEGLKYYLRDVVKEGKEVLITGVDDAKYNEELPLFMKQHFRQLKENKINERVITIKRKDVFLFDKKTAPTTEYRFLEDTQLNPTNTLIYGDKVVIVTWDTPITAIMIKNKGIATTYRNHFERLWEIAER